MLQWIGLKANLKRKPWFSVWNIYRGVEQWRATDHTLWWHQLGGYQLVGPLCSQGYGSVVDVGDVESRRCFRWQKWPAFSGSISKTYQTLSNSIKHIWRIKPTCLNRIKSCHRAVVSFMFRFFPGWWSADGFAFFDCAMKNVRSPKRVRNWSSPETNVRWNKRNNM